MTKVSVIIPLHDHAATVAETIESVVHQHDLGEISVEIVVVDDCSTDGGPELVASTFSDLMQRDELLLLRHDARRKAAAARNTGYRACSGELLVFLDSDDLFTPRRLRTQIDALAAHPEAGIVSGRMEEFAEAGWAGRPASGPIATNIAGVMMLRREAFERLGLFNEAMAMREVVEWGARVIRSGVEVLSIEDVVLRRRLHSGNHGLAHSPAASTSELLKTMRAHLDAKRTE